MAIVEFHALNISAHPHPTGIYHELFQRVSGKRLKYHGEKIAALSKPTESRDGFFRGFVFTWTEVDKEQPILDTLLMDEPTEETLSKINIPDNLGFNWQVFNYVFREADHILVFESRNDEGRTFAASSAERFFKRLFDENIIKSIQFTLPRPSNVEVDLVVEASSLEKVFSLPNLYELDIAIALPNADDNTEEADEIIKHLEKIKAGRQIISYRAAKPDEGLKADERVQAEGEAALRHGYVQGKGRRAGKQVSTSTKEYPRKETAYVDPAASTVDTAIQVALRFVARVRGN